MHQKHNKKGKILHNNRSYIYHSDKREEWKEE